MGFNGQVPNVVFQHGLSISEKISDLVLWQSFSFQVH